MASIDEMLDQIELVFSRLKEFNLKIKPKMCYFFQHSIVFLGYVLSADGISANPKKVDAVKNWPVPMSAKELHSFFGLASYYCCFIPKFTVIAKCLHDLVGPTNVKKKNKKEPEAIAITNSDTEFNWTGEHQEVFDLLKTLLTSVPVLGYPDFSRPFDLETDALLQGLGAVLSKRDGNGKAGLSHMPVGPCDPVKEQCETTVQPN